jgi:hypothetical protein
VREFEVTDGRRIVKKDSEKNFEKLTSEEHPGLRDLKITVVKGNRARGREFPDKPDKNIIYETDRKAACRISGSNTPYNGGTPTETSHTSEIQDYHEEGTLIYILCRDEDDNHNSFPYVIDKTSPTLIEDLEVTATKQDSKYKMKFEWTAPIDAYSGLKKYHIRVMENIELRYFNWYSSAVSVEGEIYGDLDSPSTEVAHEEEYITNNVFDPESVYYFAIRTEDGAGNIAALSNVVMIETES